MTLEPDSILYNRYRILETLGKGGMGAVYRAIDESLGVQVAVKENLIEDEEAIRQFRREATILANLRHQNLPRVTDHFVIEGQGQYLVMDFVEGEDLKQRMKRMGKLPEQEVPQVGPASENSGREAMTLPKTEQSRRGCSSLHCGHFTPLSLSAILRRSSNLSPHFVHSYSYIGITPPIYTILYHWLNTIKTSR